ncbi:MAG: 50S ribosomal protein L3 [Patescibacteria group bacterium]
MKIIGKKESMTQIFDDRGIVRPVTVVAANPDDLTVGDLVAVSGLSKGKGFQGVVKRHGFHGGPRSHGQKHSEREPGAIGGGGGRAGGRVAKGIRMAGRMGGNRVTVRNLKIVALDKEANQILIGGAVPGRRGTKLELNKLKAKS